MDFMERKKLERLKRMEILQAKKKKEDKMVNDANEFMDKAKNLVSKKKFIEAKFFYQKAAETFQELKWTQQAQMLLAEVENMEKKQKEYEDSVKQRILQKKKEDEEFEQNTQKILAEKAKKERLRQEAMNRLPPHLQRKVNEAAFLEKRAEKDINAGKFKKAISRYNVILELYNVVGFKADKTEPIKKKIENLEKKL